MLLNPKGDDAQSFKREWLKHDTIMSSIGLNVYILVDPANEKRKTSDWSSFMVVGVDGNHNRIVLDIVRDRLNLTERTEMLFNLHARWSVQGNIVKHVIYEQYGMQADIAHIEDEQRRRNYRFLVRKIGGSMPKTDRIKRLIPVAEQKLLILPHARTYTQYDGMTVDLVQQFIEEEYLAFPVSEHDDMLDCLARIEDPDAGVVYPRIGTHGGGIVSGVRVKTGNSRLDKRHKRPGMRA